MSREANLNPVAVMGAGAVGCYYGGMLARAGHEVTLIARAQHVEAVQKRGLRMETKAFDANVPVQASAEASGARGAKLVLFSVKSTDTARAGAARCGPSSSSTAPTTRSLRSPSFRMAAWCRATVSPR